jgi:hypothetical protein
MGSGFWVEEKRGRGQKRRGSWIRLLLKSPNMLLMLEFK